jgi:hypothetical protein
VLAVLDALTAVLDALLAALDPRRVRRGDWNLNREPRTANRGSR